MVVYSIASADPGIIKQVTYVNLESERISCIFRHCVHQLHDAYELASHTIYFCYADLG